MVRGTKTDSDVFSNSFNMGASFNGQSLKEVIFKNVISSAPSSKYRFANSTGFPNHF